MRKLLAILLVGIMVFSLAACGNKEPANTPSDPTENQPVEVKWEYKDIEAPALDVEMQDVIYIPGAGAEFPDKLVVTPLTEEKFDFDKTVSELKQLECLKDWFMTTTTMESAVPVFDKDANQFTTYMYGHSITLSEPNDGEARSRQLVISYAADVDNFVGYSHIAVDFEYDPEFEEKIAQDDMFEILKVVYGEEYANYLCYAQMSKHQDDTTYHDVVNGDAVASFNRYEGEGFVGFAIVCSNNAENVFNGNPGDYEPVMDFSVLAEILKWEENECNFADLSTLGKVFVTKHYGDGSQFAPATMATYHHAVENDADGQIESFITQLLVLQPDVAEEDLLDITLTSTVWSDRTETLAAFTLGMFDADKIEENTEAMRQKALAMVNDILGEEGITDAFEDGKYYTMKVDGKDTGIKFTFDVSPDQNNEHAVAVLQFATSTDLSAFEKE